MSEQPSVAQLREKAHETLSALRGLSRDEDLREAKELVVALRDHREYGLMGRLAEAVSRCDPNDAKNRRLYAQFLIDTGKATAAIDVLQPLFRRLPEDHSEYAEASGLLGRAYKQIFVEAGDKGTAVSRKALKKAIEGYRRPYERDPSRTWHGVNLAAVLARTRALGLRTGNGLDPRAIAAQVIATLEATPAEQRGSWFLATLAEASLALGDWDAIEENIRQYVAAPGVSAFQVAGTLRQFTEIWDLESRGERERALVDVLRARLMRLQGGELRLAPTDVDRLQAQSAPPGGRFEALLGPHGAQTYQWWKTGLERARSVAAIRNSVDGQRMGTGFLVRAGDLGREPADERLVLTNFHVVNAAGANQALRPADAEVVFEVGEPGKAFAVAEIVWSSPADRHDASLLRLAEPVANTAPLPIAPTLPVLEGAACVYVIGHAGGRDLAFSFQDNQLLDHEGAPGGQPQIPDVCRVHYHAPTEGGSSGSPVFNSRLWQVIALHHSGGRLGVPKLNGKPGTYAANEGISLPSIVAAMKT